MSGGSPPPLDGPVLIVSGAQVCLRARLDVIPVEIDRRRSAAAPEGVRRSLDRDVARSRPDCSAESGLGFHAYG